MDFITATFVEHVKLKIYLEDFDLFNSLHFVRFLRVSKLILNNIFYYKLFYIKKIEVKYVILLLTYDLIKCFIKFNFVNILNYIM